MNPVYNSFLFGNQGVVPKYTGFTDKMCFSSFHIWVHTQIENY